MNAAEGRKLGESIAVERSLGLVEEMPTGVELPSRVTCDR